MFKQYDYDDVLILPATSEFKSRSEVNIYKEIQLNAHTKLEYAPVFAANMDGVGTFAMADVLAKNKMFTCLTKHYTEKELLDYFEETDNQYAVISIGMSEDELSKFRAVNEVWPRAAICVDVANGHMASFADFIFKIRQEFPSLFIIAGNVATKEAFGALSLAGANAIKIGIGPGAHCETRRKTGVGRKMISLIDDIVNDYNFWKIRDEAENEDRQPVLIIADGGIKNPGDIGKALVAGADAVMIGTMLAGCDEGGGEVITKYFKTNEIANYHFEHARNDN